MRRKRGGLFQGFVFGPDGERERRALRPELAEAYRLWALHEDIREGRSIRITLGVEAQAEAKARARLVIESVRRNNPGRTGRAEGILQGRERDPWRELDSVAGEVAVSRVIGVPLAPYTDGPGREGDLANGDEVRQTELPHGTLRVHEFDAPDRRFWLVTGTYRPRQEFVVVGWFLAGEAQARFPLEVRRVGATAAHWVPQTSLRPVLPLEKGWAA